MVAALVAPRLVCLAVEEVHRVVWAAANHRTLASLTRLQVFARDPVSYPVSWPSCVHLAAGREGGATLLLSYLSRLRSMPLCNYIHLELDRRLLFCTGYR